MNPWLRAFLLVLGVVLMMIGLLAGGCSAFFTPEIFKGGDYIEAVRFVWALGLGLAVLGTGAGLWILRRLSRGAP